MKTIKLILATLLMMVAFTVQAQERVVQVYKDGKVVKEYPASEVKSVEYVPVIDYGYYREAPEWEAQNSTTGWIKLESNNQTIPIEKDIVNIAVATVSNTIPTLTAKSNLFGSFDCTVVSATEGGFAQKITINGKQYYFWISAENLTDDDNPSITIKQ